MPQTTGPGRPWPSVSSRTLALLFTGGYVGLFVLPRSLSAAVAVSSTVAIVGLDSLNSTQLTSLVLVLSAVLLNIPRSFVLGIIFCLILVLAAIAWGILYSASHPRPTYVPHLKSYKFADPAVWDAELAAIAAETPIKEPVFPDSFLISDSVDVLLEYICRDFVLSWYHKFTDDTAFPAAIDAILRKAVIRISERLEIVSWADFLVAKLLPVVTDHFSAYVSAAAAIRMSATGGRLTESRDLDDAIAAQFPHLHPGVSLKNFEYATHRKQWLSSRVHRIVALVIDADQLESPIVSRLIDEIVASSVMFPIISMLSDPDFWNQIVIRSAGSTIQDQNKVQRFRKALEVHTGASAGSLAAPAAKLAKPPSSLSKSMLRLSPNADQAVFDKFIRDIQKCQSLSEAKQTRYYISVQLKRTAKEGVNKQYQVRLQRAQDAINKQITLLSAGSDLSMSVMDSITDPRENYSLSDILNDPSCSLYFMEYMDQRRRTPLLQFWLTANSLHATNPLDSDVLDDTDPLGGLHVDRPKAAQLETSPALPMTNKDDIIQIYHQYLGTHSPLGISDSVVNPISSFVEAETPTYLQYLAAKQSIFEAQAAVFRSIEAKDLAKFKTSDLYLKYLASAGPVPVINTKRSLANIDNLQLDAEIDEPDASQLPSLLSRHQRKESQADEMVVRAVEEAFNNIMTGNNEPKSTEVTTPSPGLSEKTSGLDVLLDVKSPSRESPSPVGNRPQLFESDDSGSDLGSQDLEDMKREDESAIHLAAPGDLGLTEAITTLSKEIENLQNQQDVVEFLLQKAELTNNVSELRILQKSQSSLEREIQRKELQRQQYIVQESENSLYGKSNIQIQSYVHGGDSNGEYILYIIEVQKLGTDGDVSAGWIVPRRYSQFFELHQLLRERFPRTRMLDFPKKRVIMKFQKSLIDSRRMALEKYLKELLHIPEVCQNKEFRTFLSSDTFSVDSLRVKSTNLASSVGSLDDGEESLAPPQLSMNPIVTSSTSRPSSFIGIPPARIASPPPIQSHVTNGNSSIAAEAAQEASSLDGLLVGTSAGKRPNAPFIQPICDLFIQIFGLDKGDNWLRGRAVVLLIQQLLGGTIEKKVRDSVANLTSVRSISNILQTFRDSMWPNGERKPPSVPRTEAEKAKAKHEAMLLLQKLVSSASSKVLGGSTARYASRNIFDMYQNEILNAHLVFTLFDVVLDELFPELTRE